MSDVAVVTGAGRGIGAAVARRLAERGYSVVVTDLDAEAAAATAAALGAAAHPMAHDVRRAEQHRAVALLAASLGDVRVWVNNAGVLRTGPLWQQDDEVIATTVDVNLLGVVHGTRAALEVMRPHGRPADVVNLGSMSAYGPLPGLGIYAATKAAVVSWTQTTAAELRAAGSPVRVHVVCPDGVHTDMVGENAHDPASALIFSAPLLPADRVADAVVGLIGSRRVVRSLPRYRAALARLSGLAPAAVVPAMGLLTAIGERRRRAHHGRRS